MTRVFIVAALISVGVIGTAVGHGKQAGAVLDRIVAQQPDGGPFAYAPPIKDWSDQAVIAIGSAADTVVGFEAAPEVEHLLRPVTDARKAQLDSRRRIPLAGKTVREALDTIVAIDPRYRWVDVHGVPIVRPWASWVDPNHLLNKVVGAVEWPETNLTKALFDAVTLMTGTVPTPAMTAARPPFFNVQTGPIAVMELLNTAALAHGHAFWQVRHQCTPNDPRALQVQLQSYAHGGVGGGVSCRIISHER